MSTALGEHEVAVARLLRDIRRGTASLRMRQVIFGADDLLDQGQLDSLDLVVHDEGCRMADLAEALRVDASTATRAVQRLEQRGLVERTRCVDDGRVVRVVATDLGRQVHAEVAARRRRFLSEVFATFDEDELAELRRLLHRLMDAFDAQLD